MSWTKREFVLRAFEEIGLAPYVFDLTADQLQAALYRLDSMIAEWNAIGMRLSYPLPATPSDSDLDEDSNVPDAANSAIFLGLACRLGPMFGKQLSPDLKMAARQAYNSMAIICQETDIPQALRTSIPAGAGNKMYRTVFMPATEELIAVGFDGMLEFDGNDKLNGETL